MNQVYSLHETFVSSGWNKSFSRWNIFFSLHETLVSFRETAVSSKRILPDEPKNRPFVQTFPAGSPYILCKKEIRLSADCAQADDKLTSG